MKPRIVLFDIDGTLVTTGGAGRRAMRRAFGAFCDREDALDGFGFGGKTDRGIVRVGLTNAGLNPTDEAIDKLLEVYVGMLGEEMVNAENCLIHDGVHEAIDIAHKSGAAVGLATGNIKDGARLKLTRMSLWDPFDFGGFGCDHEVRSELVRAGAQRGADKLDRPLESCEVLVIGDTPLDVAAARAIGARCLAVATGSSPIDALKAAGADVVVTDLREMAARAFLA